MTTKTATKTAYRQYIQSEDWQTRRKQFLSNVYAACERCEMPRWVAVVAYDQDLNVHHKSYANLGHETVLDIETLCRRCHEIETFGRSDLHEVKRYNCAMCKGPCYDPWSGMCGRCFGLAEGIPPGYIEDDKESPITGHVLWMTYVRDITWHLGMTALLEFLAIYEDEARSHGVDPYPSVQDRKSTKVA